MGALVAVAARYSSSDTLPYPPHARRLALTRVLLFFPDERILATAAWTLSTFGLVSKREFQRKPRHSRPRTASPRRTRSTSPTPSNPNQKRSQTTTTTPKNVRPLQPNHRPHLPPKHRHDNKLVRHPLQQQPIHQLSKQLHNLVFGSHLNNATMLRLGRRAQRRRLRVVLLPGQYRQDVGGFQSGFCGVFEEGGEGEGGCWTVSYTHLRAHETTE